jgi:hypothetical protein
MAHRALDPVNTGWWYDELPFHTDFDGVILAANNIER